MTFREKIAFAWDYMKKYRANIFILIISVVLMALLEPTIPYLTGQMINAVTAKATFYQLNFNQLVILLLALSTVTLLVGQINGYFSSLLEDRVQQDFILDFSDHVLDLPLDYHLQQKGGAVHQIISKATSAFSFLFNFLVYNFLPQALQMIASLIIMFVYNWRLAFGMLGVVIFFFVLSFTFKMTEMITQQRSLNEDYKKIFGDLGDALGNIFTIKTFNGEDSHLEQREKQLKEVFSNSKKLSRLSAERNVVIGAVLRYGRLAILCLVLFLFGQNKVSMGDMLMFVMYLGMVIGPLNMLSNQIGNLRKYLVNLEDAAQLRQIEREQDDPAAIDKDLSGAIEFDEVTFNYPEQEEGILSNVSFKVPAGNILAVVGESGSGKTTLYKLLLRLYDQEQGQIKFDGLPVQQLSRYSLRRQIAVVPQDPILFHESILYNIRYGNSGASEEEVMTAAKQAQIHDFILTLPKGYHTVVGERGVKLSGGQVQRVAIARAFLRKPKVIIFDEATSSLDLGNKVEVLNAMQQVIKGRTAIIITHDFSAINQLADQILVLQRGKIVQCGKHQELLSMDGCYRQLWQKYQDLSQTVGC
jgi:ATP-binding cassette subfamily B protein